MPKEKTVERKTIKEVWERRNKFIKKLLIGDVLFLLLMVASGISFLVDNNINFAVALIGSVIGLFGISILLFINISYRNLMIGIKKALGEEDNREVTFKE